MVPRKGSGRELVRAPLPLEEVWAFFGAVSAAAGGFFTVAASLRLCEDTKAEPRPGQCAVHSAGEGPCQQGCVRREGTSEAAREAVGQAVGGGCQSGWVRLLSVTNVIEAGGGCQSGWVRLLSVTNGIEAGTCR